MSEFDLYSKYLDLGIKLGRSGKDLATWVEDKSLQLTWTQGQVNPHIGNGLFFFAAKSEPYRSTVHVAERKDDSRPHAGGGRSNYFSKGHRSPSLQSNAALSPSWDRNSSDVAGKNVGQGLFRPSSGSVSSNVTCFQCGGKGHVRRECPSRPKEANFAFSVPELPFHCCAAKIDYCPRVAGISFRIEDGILRRLYAKSKLSSVQTNIAVPESLRQIVLSYAHESLSAGHSGFQKTLSAIRDCFSWPGVCSDVKNYITSCHLCKSRPRTGRDRPAPFQHNRIRQGWRTAQGSVCDSASQSRLRHEPNIKHFVPEPTAYVSAISEEVGGEIGWLVATSPLASENGAVVIDPSLSASQVQDVKELLLEFQDILTSAPGCTNTLCHYGSCYTGHMVSSGTLVPVQKKMDKILQLPVPVKKKEVRSLLGLVNYFRHFIADFASISAPLSGLLRKGTPEKDRDGTLMPCRYASQKLLPRECRYSAIERETLALVFAVTQFQRYLIFKHFVLQTDHKPLAYLRTGSPKNARLMRCALALQEFSFQVVHIPGSENVHADVLSRLC
ncbi:retrovirus-related pol polyprotein from transposon 17.6 [Plakobranchus ocellatus]|uniref:Retrovirus-related pol polyprotein from transposon 17.6 n=1 Tax=Plakobranchus ocellatus TaxID=259542 RepID=A0AAV4AZM8_9GAST|nr:retrovirus-related pol polyprotein from transposon 17.6 [Plakobranchus ocellatus]